MQLEPLHLRSERWAIAIAHRRAGKTVACLNELIRKAYRCELSNPRYAYVAPFLNQAKDIAWTYLQDYTEFFGRSRKINATELWIELPNRARIRIYGADNPDRLRGRYFDGVVLDEYGDMDPAVWTRAIRPMLSDRGRHGWAVFIGTPRGKNGFHKLWVDAENDPDWFRLELKASATGLLDAKELADARKAMSDDEYAQEYECSFEAAVRGAYWGKELNQAEEGNRITSVPHDPRLAVHTAWDLGIADSTVIWFVQVCGGETRIIDVLKGEGEGLEWYANQLRGRPAQHGRDPSQWVWGNHYLPHDAAAREIGSGKTRIEILAGYGIVGSLLPRMPVEDGIQAVRGLLATCWFDKEKCKAGLEALRMYRREWDNRAQEFRTQPLHDWTSHYADAFRTFAMGHQERPVYATRIRRRRSNGWVA